MQIPFIFDKEGLSFYWQSFLVQREGMRQLNRNFPELPEHNFLSFVLMNLSFSHSQLFQDLFVSWSCDSKTDGFFVEFGATDGELRSNSYLLEKMGWQGILAEPNPIWHEALQRRRKAVIDKRCVWNRSGEQLEFAGTENGELATISAFVDADLHAKEREAIVERFMVPTVTLNDLLAEHGAPHKIDYISIDTEGSEPEIIEAFDFARYDVHVFTIEHNYNETSRARVYQTMTRNGYKRVFEAFSMFDDWYVKGQ